MLFKKRCKVLKIFWVIKVRTAGKQRGIKVLKNSCIIFSYKQIQEYVSRLGYSSDVLN